MNQDVTSLLRTFSTSRRQFLKASAIAGGLTAASHFTPAAIAGFSLGRAAALEGDVNVLNYALTLEHFESALYSAIVGSGLFSGERQEYVTFFGAQEAAHVTFLTTALQAAGAVPVEAEEYNLPATDDEQTVLDLLVTVEDLGAAAYLGAAPLIQNGDYLTAAVAIHNVEAYHATGARILAGQTALPFAFAEGMSPEEVIEAVTPFFMDGMPGTGAGGSSTGNGAGRALGIAGLGAAAVAGAGLMRTRRVEATETQ